MNLIASLVKIFGSLLRKFQFDTNDSYSALCGSNCTLRNIMELICNEPVEFNFKSRSWSFNMEMSESGLQDPITYYY